jgi:hypothetical protein
MLEDRAQREEDAKERPRKDFLDQCKGSRHLSGEHEGARKSGSWCRKEWKALSESAGE